MSRFLPFTKELALDAGKLLKSHFQKRVKIKWKRENDPVTEIDKASEKLITEKIKKYFPSHEILAEEGTKNIQGKKSDYRWIIDPLDGTNSFIHSIPHFAVSIALEIKNKISVGVCYDPIKDELFYAEAGKGAFLNKKKIHVSKVDTIDKAIFATGFGSNRQSELVDQNLILFSKMTKEASAIRRLGSAALDCCYVACGRFDGYWELRLNLWDIGAGVIIVKEAGGKATTMSGEEIRGNKTSILASNGLLHKKIFLALK